MTQTNSLTKKIINYLNYSGFVVWRNNNGAVYSVKQKTFRKNPTSKKGVFDIIGFRKSDGKHLEVEIKTGKDRMSDGQMGHYAQLISCKCITFIAHTFDEFEKEFNQQSK